MQRNVNVTHSLEKRKPTETKTEGTQILPLRDKNFNYCKYTQGIKIVCIIHKYKMKFQHKNRIKNQSHN